MLLNAIGLGADAQTGQQHTDFMSSLPRDCTPEDSTSCQGLALP